MSSTYADSTLSPSTASSIAASTSTISGVDHLRSTFQDRIRSLTHLKRSLSGQTPWLSTITLSPSSLASAFDTPYMTRRTLRYSLLGLSLSSILELSSPADLARAIISLINELDSCTDETISSLTSGTGAANFGTQRPKMRNLFRTNKSTIKRATAAQAISEFGPIDTSVGIGEGTSYLMAPNIPFQMDFFQTFFTLCDMLSEIYYKMISFLPKDDGVKRTSSPPNSASRHASGEFDRTGSISQTLSTDPSGSGEAANTTPTTLNAMTQELLLKADAKIKKTIQLQVKEIDGVARQMIKDELASLDPLLKELGMPGSGSKDGVTPFPMSSGVSTRSGSLSGGLPTSSTTSLPFGFSNQPTASTTTPGRATSAFRRQPKPDAHLGHHQINLPPTPDSESTPSLIRSRSGKLRRAFSSEQANSETPTSDSPISPS